MVECRVYLIGAQEPAFMRLAGATVEDVAMSAVRHRFIAGLLVSLDGLEPPTPVAIPTARVQMITEVCQ